ncbi:hypothetical protein FP2506_02200 [Fulvimarina pelagi HTCC2506]|uniref:Uncharacterized protein n=2 Tax=Fulvimarina pelagi TaxID=217511 RepID=Q0FYI0_9HYPH|nr:hypothetical protein FP2506_02200 [Fulvimarina pelagi HTCC2506]
MISTDRPLGAECSMRKEFEQLTISIGAPKQYETVRVRIKLDQLEAKEIGPTRTLRAFGDIRRNCFYIDRDADYWD